MAKFNFTAYFAGARVALFLIRLYLLECHGSGGGVVRLRRDDDQRAVCLQTVGLDHLDRLAAAIIDLSRHGSLARSVLEGIIAFLVGLGLAIAVAVKNEEQFVFYAGVHAVLGHVGDDLPCARQGFIVWLAACCQGDREKRQQQ